jgi:hypothetical protein
MQLSALKLDGKDSVEYYEIRLYLNLYYIKNFSMFLSPEKNDKWKCVFMVLNTLNPTGILGYKIIVFTFPCYSHTPFSAIMLLLVPLSFLAETRSCSRPPLLLQTAFQIAQLHAVRPSLTLSNPIFLPPAYSPTLIYFGRERGWWVTCKYPTVSKEKKT